MAAFIDEIREQPRVFARIWDEERERVAGLARAVRERAPSLAFLAARGTSDNAATYCKYALESAAGLPTALAAASLFTLYETPPNLARALVLGISQSGAGPDVVQVLRKAREQGALTVAITNTADSDITRVAEYTLFCHAGLERAVAATKTYTAELYVAALLALSLADNAGLLHALSTLPLIMEEALAVEEDIAARIERYRYMQRCAVLARGFNYCTALEFALKLKEATYSLAQPYSAADFLHGPVALIEPGFPVFLLSPADATRPMLAQVAEQLREKEAELLVVSDQKGALGEAQVDLVVPAGVPAVLTPLLYVLPGQLFTYHLARARGLDADRPRGLSKVTLTR